MHQILQTYLRRLTNLSSRNRSLFLLKPPVDSFIDLHELDFLLNRPSFEIVEQLLSGKEKIPVCNLLDSRHENTNKSSQKLKKIKRNDAFIFEEQGAKDLNIGWPFVSGQFADGTPVRCPLLLFPVEIVEENNQWVIVLRKEVPISINQSFLLAYAYFNGVPVDEQLMGFDLEEFDQDSRVFRTSLYKLFKDSSVEIDFGQDFFVDGLKNFRPFRKDVFLQESKKGELKLYPEALLGLFPLSNNTLIKDYEYLIDNKNSVDLEDFFVHQKNVMGSALVNTEIKEENTFTPFPMDMWQEHVIKTIKKGESMVVQGPPGTGKSQLICNLIADYISRGKTVLVVCQKRVALDVVYDRMKKIGYEKFMGLVHDHRQDRKYIFELIAKQIDSLYEYQMLNNGLDAINLERKFLVASRKIDQITEELTDYKSALYNEEEAGLSAKQMYLISDPHKPFVDFKHLYKFFRMDELASYQKQLEIRMNYIFHLNGPSNFWAERKNFQAYNISDLSAIKEVVNDIPVFLEYMSRESKDLTGVELSFREFESIQNEKETISSILEKLKSHDVYSLFCLFIKQQINDDQILKLEKQVARLMDCFKGEGPERSLAMEEIGPFQLALKKGAEARSRPISYMRWKFFSKDKMWVKRILIANDLQENKNSLEQLMDKIDNRLNLQHNLQLLTEAFPFIKYLPEGYKRPEWDQWSKNILSSLEFLKQYKLIKRFSEIFHPNEERYDAFENKVNGLLRIANQLPLKQSYWSKYLTLHQINALLLNEFQVDDVIKRLEIDFDDLRDLDKLSASSSVNESSVIQKLEDYIQTNPEIFDDNSVTEKLEIVAELFENSLTLAWLEHLELKYPILRIVTTRKFEIMEEELQQVVEEKSNLAKDIVLLNIRERTYKDAEYNRLKNMVTYRDLNHQVTKKRRIWPLRKLLEEFSEEVFNLMPCWLASPESVSALFSMDQKFDLVIFDEASQCFSEKGIPAMYRGRQLLVSGDSKQLRPSSLYSVRFVEEDVEEMAELEVDSLLELSSQYLRQFQLRGHYRSKHPDLIKFSNFHFYDNNLQLLPFYEDFISSKKRLHYVKVDGVWENKKNESEAAKVIELVKSVQLEYPESTIGIVTFNIGQKECIEDLIDMESSEENWNPPHDLFVKNIENVQGDERDIIIFSVGYAPDILGKVKLQFGTLNMQGGENRLNVAVSRAREQVYLVTSIWPEDLKTKNTQYDGPKMLKEYLHFVKRKSEAEEQPILIKKPQQLEKQEWLLRDVIANLGNELSSSVSMDEHFPFADLTMHVQTGQKGLIFTDDDHYKQTITMKEPHAYTPLMLKDRNWPYISLSSRAYWKNRNEFKEAIQRFVFSSSS